MVYLVCEQEENFQDKFDKMKHYRPDVVFMNLGGNDITESTDIQNLVKRLKNIVKELYENGITKVFVATVIERGSFPEWTGLTRPIFNKIRHALNEKLRTELGTDLVDVGKKIKYHRHYNNDLVHPRYHQGGMYLLGIHDIWSKTISLKRRLVECNIWSIRSFAEYDFWSTTTIGRKFIELRRNLVEFWSKTDLYRKINIVYIYGSHISNIFSRQYQY